jgi:Protein of unknown function (DUF3889)
MKTILIVLCIYSTLTITSSFGSVINILTVNAESNVPSYAKWGRMAMQKTKERYPHAKIYDYLHVKREQKGQYSLETFKLWLNENNNKFEVMVNIKFETNTEKTLNVSVKKKTSPKAAAPISTKEYSHIIYYHTSEGILYDQKFQQAFEQLERPDMVKCRILFDQNEQENEVTFALHNTEDYNGKQLHAEMKKHINDIISREKSPYKKIKSIKILELSYHYNKENKESLGGGEEIDTLLKGVKDIKIKRFNIERREKQLKEFFHNN